MTPAEFIDRWKPSGGAEMANSQSFIIGLCDLLQVPHPEPTLPDETQNSYVFEKAIEFNNNDGTTSQGRVDLYRRGCFILESKQGAEAKDAKLEVALATKTKKKKFRSGTAKRGTPGWELAMVKARQQARRYAEAIPDEWPPFLIVADVGYCFDLYADFTQSGKNYVPFPDPNSYRISLKELEVEETRELFKAIWLDPHSLDPSRRSAKVTREVADRLAKLAKLMEGKHNPETVAQFLMRCLFTMFAEDVEIGGFRKQDFTKFLISRRGKLDTFVPMLESLWQTMDTGGFSVILEGQLKQFNGGLFEDQKALPVSEDQLDLLIEAAEADWRDVEPAIFGTLLERALDPVERHKLGAHYTPRAYVERLVMPTIIEPLREEWDTVYATAVSLSESGKATESQKVVRQFHQKLCETTILDPACGSGNFLYVSLELMKRLEGEVLKALLAFGEKQIPLLTVDPHQFLGIEVNPRAAAITDLVLWIGYLQWHFRARGNDPLNEPIIRKFHNIENRDAVLAWDSIEPVVDEDGNPVTRWDGRTTKPHPVTGEEVPDETARVQELRYINPRKAEWPKADYIVGNPPFLGTALMRDALGDGYTKAIRRTYKELPESIDFVMYWWHNAAEQVSENVSKRFGLITTNSLRQIFNRRVIEHHLSSGESFSVIYAIPDHPWTDSTDGAAVRISMTVATRGNQTGELLRVVSENEKTNHGVSVSLESSHGKILSNLSIGADVAGTQSLLSNSGLSNRGYCLFGAGFILTPKEAQSLGFGEDPRLSDVIHDYRNGRDIAQKPRGVFVIDLCELTAEEARKKYPTVYQWVLDRVKPERDHNNRKSRRENWWIYGEPNPKLRRQLEGLQRYIATVETSKHRFFVFLDRCIRPDNMLVNVALDGAYELGVMSSKIHVSWALAAGGILGPTPRYNKTRCFETFPFPDPDEPTKQRIRELGEQLDAHRKRQQELHPDLTMTGMYNVLEKLRAFDQENPELAAATRNEDTDNPLIDCATPFLMAQEQRAQQALTKKELVIHQQGLVSVLKEIHDELDAAVFDAYGWPHDLTDEEILERLVALNHERAEEERRGNIRWLRPDFQNPNADQKKQGKLDIKTETSKSEGKKAAKTKVQKQPWPKTLPERITAVRATLIEQGQPASVADIAKHFTRANKENLEELLETLVAVGQARATEDGRYAA